MYDEGKQKKLQSHAYGEVVRHIAGVDDVHRKDCPCIRRAWKSVLSVRNSHGLHGYSVSYIGRFDGVRILLIIHLTL